MNSGLVAGLRDRIFTRSRAFFVTGRLRANFAELLEGRQGRQIAMARNAEIGVFDASGRERERHPVVYGAQVKVKDGQQVKPGEMLLGFGGNGSASHLAVELFKLMAQLQMVNVPYKSSEAAAADAVNGKLMLALVEVGAAMPHVKAGKVKAIAVTSAKRVFAASDAPSFAEAGLTGYEATDWLGIVVPVATPGAIVARLNADFVATLKRAEVRDRIIAAGAEPAGGARGIRGGGRRAGRSRRGGIAGHRLGARAAVVRGARAVRRWRGRTAD